MKLDSVFKIIFSFGLFLPALSDARIAKPNLPDKAPSVIEEVATRTSNCRAGRGFKARGCRAVQVRGGDVLGQKCGGGHKGCDYSRSNKGKKASPIVSVQGGKVAFAGWSGAYGNRVVIDHGGGVFTTYSHLSELHVKRGMSVSRGQSLGKMGSTGKSSGVHLHFEKIQGGRFVDPKGIYAPFCG
jgi:murein DD-endopeptidase MepM/ murein hydrolase activator NlpD